MDISRFVDNGSMCDCRWSTERADSDLRKLLYPQPLHGCIVNGNRDTGVSCKGRDMSESLYSPIRGFSNDGSDFSDTSLSIACSSSTAPVPYEEFNHNSNSVYRGCSNGFTHSNSPRRRRRKVVSRSLILDHGYPKSNQFSVNNGLSDSGLMMRFEGNHPPDSDSSSSGCSNVTPVRVIRRKPKTIRRSMPPTYYPNNHRPILQNHHMPYTWVSIFCCLNFNQARQLRLCNIM